MCFAPQKRAVFFFYLSSPQMAPHPPLYRAYFSTLQSPKALGKTQCFATSRLFYLLAHLDLLSFSFLFTDLQCSASLLSHLPASAGAFDHAVRSLTSKFPSIIAKLAVLARLECMTGIAHVIIIISIPTS